VDTLDRGHVLVIHSATVPPDDNPRPVPQQPRPPGIEARGDAEERFRSPVIGAHKLAVEKRYGTQFLLAQGVVATVQRTSPDRVEPRSLLGSSTASRAQPRRTTGHNMNSPDV
jgi:hypothetical protein